MFTAFISLIFGLIIGYLAQRSRMCFIGGMRDFVLVRDTYLLKGLVAFFVTAAILFPLANALGGDTLGYPWYDREKSRAALELARDVFVFAACWIPDDLLVAATEKFNKARGFALPGGLMMSYTLLTAIVGGLGIGFLSTLANGCPLRQHVLAASGNRSAWVYLGGFYLGALMFAYWLHPWMATIMP